MGSIRCYVGDGEPATSQGASYDLHAPRWHAAPAFCWSWRCPHPLRGPATQPPCLQSIASSPTRTGAHAFGANAHPLRALPALGTIGATKAATIPSPRECRNTFACLRLLACPQRRRLLTAHAGGENGECRAGGGRHCGGNRGLGARTEGARTRRESSRRWEPWVGGHRGHGASPAGLCRTGHAWRHECGRL